MLHFTFPDYFYYNKSDIKFYYGTIALKVKHFVATFYWLFLSVPLHVVALCILLSSSFAQNAKTLPS